MSTTTRKWQFESAILLAAAGCSRTELQFLDGMELGAVGGTSRTNQGGASQSAARNGGQGANVTAPGSGSATVPSGGASQVGTKSNAGSGSVSPGVGGISGSAGGSLLTASLPNLPEGRHVTMRITPATKSSPAVAASGSVLGVAFADGKRLRFGVNGDPSRKTTAWSFTDVAEVVTDSLYFYSVCSAVVGGENGFDVVWTGFDYDSTSSTLWRAKLNRAGEVVSGPYSEDTGDITYCSLATHQGTVAIACAELPSHRDDEEQGNSVWVELCETGTSCVKSAIEVAKEVSRPAIVWDGNAFDLVYAARGPSNDGLKLARIGVHGESILPPRTLDSTPAEESSFPGLAWDGERLVVAHGSIPTLSAYDTNGVRVSGPKALLNETTALTALMGYQILAAPNAYAVLALGSEGDGPPYDLGGVRLMSIDRSTTDRVNAVLFHPYGTSRAKPTASVTMVDGELVAVKAPRSANLELGRFNPSTLELKADPAFVFDPPGPLSPVAVHCDAATCYVLAHQSDPSVGSFGTRTGVWQVDRATGRVIETERGGTALGMPRAIPRVRAGQFVALLESTVFTDPGLAEAPRLNVWLGPTWWSSYSWPEDSPHEDPQIFVEGDALRLLYQGQRESGPAPAFQRLFANGQYGAPTPISPGASVYQCGNVYIRQDFTTDGWSTTRIMRWRPGVDADFVLLVDTALEGLSALCCSDSVILAATSADARSEPTTFVYSIDGTLLNKYEGGIQACASRNDKLLVLPDAEGNLKGYRVYPDGTLKAFELAVPDGLRPTSSDLASGSGPWAFEVGDEVLALAWNDVGRLGTYLSLWRLP